MSRPCFRVLPVPAVLIALAALLGAAGSFVPASAAPAAPTSVLLYPAGGRIQVATELTARRGVIAFDLPAGAQVDTLALGVDGGAVISLETAAAPALPDSPAVAAIREALGKARREAAALDGEMAAIAARIALWSKPQTAFTQVGELEKLDAAIPERLKALYADQAALAPLREAAARKVARLERELAEAGGDAPLPLTAEARHFPAPGRDVVRVTAKVRLDKGAREPDGPVRVRYSYTFADCGWTPVYRLDALPGKDAVRFSQEAEIRQASGMDWTNVPLTLASADLGSGLEPAPLGSWSVRPAPEFRTRASGSLADMAAVPENMVLMQSSAPAKSIRQEETPAATIWELGRRTIPAGTPVRLAMAEEVWKAEFVRVARPARQKAAFLMAEVTLPEPVELPAGTAQYQVDGIAVGSGTFVMTGTREKIYFGTDLRVTAEMKLDARQSGSKGFVDKRQTRSWVWTIEIANHHAAPVRVRVEDPEPQSRDQSIEIRTTATPKPVVEDHVNVWNLTVPAEGRSDIAYAVDVSAPADMRLIDGR